MDVPHALMLPFPAQGHVIPLMELAHRLVERGFKITFINTEFNHNRALAALSKTGDDMDGIHLVTVPDGLEPDEDRNDIGRLIEGISNVMPGCLEELIRNITEKGEEEITCFIVDWSIACMLEVGHKMNLRSAAFWPSNPAMLAATLRWPFLS
ncbi:uncharacterized protein A4U43_C08F16480 [Asparagus officinalis]|nr:uncharacterized protein A4U43_C08F16480 [Asparagus officinalis]